MMRSPTEPVADLKALTGVQHKEPSRLQGRHAVRDGAHWRLAAAIAGRSFAHEAPASRSNGFAGDAERDAQYFRRRWGEARHAALEAAGPASRAAHEELAARYALLSQPTGRPDSALPGRAESADHARLAGLLSRRFDRSGSKSSPDRGWPGATDMPGNQDQILLT